MKKRLLAASIIACCSGMAQADVQFNGFASIRGGFTFDDDQVFAGYDDDIDFSQESLFALQATADLGYNLSATAQILSRGRNDWDAEFEWAYLTYNFTQDTAVNVGRIRMPLYYYSESVDVGYTYHWVRAPDGVYSIPFNSWEGIAISNNHRFGRFDGEVQLQYGSYSDDDFVYRGTNPPGALFEFRALAFEYVLSYSDITARVGYIHSYEVLSEDGNVPEFVDAVNAELAPFDVSLPQTYIDNLLVNDDEVRFVSAALFYDNSQVFFGGEWTKLDYTTGVLTPNEESMYITGGYRFGDWTVHATYHRDENPRITHEEYWGDGPRDASFELSRPATEFLTSSSVMAGEDSHAWSFGVNYAFHPQAIFKLDFTSFRDDIDAPGSRVDADVVSFAIDMVF